MLTRYYFTRVHSKTFKQAIEAILEPGWNFQVDDRAGVTLMIIIRI